MTNYQILLRLEDLEGILKRAQKALKDPMLQSTCETALGYIESWKTTLDKEDEEMADAIYREALRDDEAENDHLDWMIEQWKLNEINFK